MQVLMYNAETENKNGLSITLKIKIGREIQFTEITQTLKPDILVM